jgi:hypothetical protein
MRPLTFAIVFSVLYSITLIASLAFYSKDLLDQDNYSDSLSVHNGKIILAVNISSLFFMLLLLVVQIGRLRKNKTLCYPEPAGCEAFVWLLIIIAMFTAIIMSVVAFVNNCKYETDYPCHHLTSLAYIFVLVTIYTSFITVFVFLSLFFAWRCCGCRINYCQELMTGDSYSNIV